MKTEALNCSHRLPTLLALAAIAGGCDGGDGSGLQPLPAPGDTSFKAVFSEIQATVLTPSCATSGCHQGAGAPQGLRLDAVNSYGLLVNRPSSEDPAVLRVAAHDPDASYLIQKLEGTASVGAQMPLSGNPLEQSAIDVVRQWITEGAIDDRASSDSPVRVESLSPLPNSELSAAPGEVIVMFDREVDTSTVNRFTFLLEGSGGDGSFTDGNEVPIAAEAITAPTLVPKSATFRLRGALADDSYRVRLLGSGASIILDIGANALDGEFSGSFPSGDGTGGGDFEAKFLVAPTALKTKSTLDDIRMKVHTLNNADGTGR